MEKFTKQERNKIYRNATADYRARYRFSLTDPEFSAGLCKAIRISRGNTRYKMFNSFTYLFPELDLFGRLNKRGDTYYYWKRDVEGHQARALGLSFMIAMTD